MTYLLHSLLVMLMSCTPRHDGSVSTLVQKGSVAEYQLLINTMPSDILGLTYTDPSNRKFIIQKEDGLWYFAGMEEVDESRINLYLSTLMETKGKVQSAIKTAHLLPQETLIIEAISRPEPVTIQAFTDPSDPSAWIFSLSDHPGMVLESEKNDIYQNVFSNFKSLLP